MVRNEAGEREVGELLFERDIADWAGFSVETSERPSRSISSFP